MDANKHLKITRPTAESPGAPKRLNDTYPSGHLRLLRSLMFIQFRVFRVFRGQKHPKTFGHFNVFTLTPRPFQTFSMASSKTPAISTKAPSNLCERLSPTNVLSAPVARLSLRAGN